MIMSLGAVVLSLALAFTTYGLVRSNLVNDADDAAIDDSRRNGDEVLRSLGSTVPEEPRTAQQALARSGVQSYVLWYRDTYWGATSPFAAEDVPSDLLVRVNEERVSSRQLIRVDGELFLVVGIAVPTEDLPTSYYEFHSFADLDSTLSNLRLSLILAKKPSVSPCLGR